MSNEIEFGMDVGTPGGDRSAIMVMEVGQVDRFTIHVSPLPTHLMVPDYFEPDSEILELLESCRREMEKACSMPANILTARDEIAQIGNRMTSHLERLQSACLRELTDSIALRPAPPIVVDSDGALHTQAEYDVKQEVLEREFQAERGYIDAKFESVVQMNAHWMAVIEEPEPGEREMSAVRAMCRGL